MFKGIFLLWRVGLLGLALLLGQPLSAWAGTLTSAAVTPADLTAGATTSYTIQFSSATRTLASGDFFIFNTTTFGSPAADVSSATLSSLSGGTLVGNVSFQLSGRVVVQFTGGSANVGQLVTVVFGNVVNPGVTGAGPDYSLQTTDGGSTIDSAQVAGHTYTINPVPTVTTPIPDRVGNGSGLAQEDGSVVIESDLNNVFTDGDGDPLSFSVLAGHNVAVATASISGNQLTVTPQGTGTTTITIQADDSSDGTVTDSFDVQVHGLLTPADVAPASLQAGATGNVVLSFTPSTTLSATDQLFLYWPTGFVVSGATLGSVSGGTSDLTLYSNTANTGFRLNSGTFNAGTPITITIGNITNPATAGATGDYELHAQDSGDAWFGVATISGDTMVNETVAPLFENVTPSVSGFTAGSVTLAVDIDEAGTVYAVAVADGASAPSSADVRAGHNAGGSAAIAANSTTLSGSPFSGTLSLTGLSPATAYDLYVVAEDDEATPNLQATPVQLDLTTNAAPQFWHGGSAVLNVTAGGGVVELDDLLTAIDTDIGQTLTWSIDTAASVGALGGLPTSRSSNGSYVDAPITVTYTPPAAAGSDSFTIQLDDGHDSTTLAVTVNATGPVARGELLVIDSGASKALMRVDSASGDRTVLSQSSSDFLNASAVAVRDGEIYVVEINSDVIWTVDPTSGGRTLVSGGATGSGTAFQGLFDGIAIEADGNILVTDITADAVLRVDPTTGARSLLVQDSSNLSGVDAIGVDPISGDIYVADQNNDSIFHIDPLSGALTLVSGQGTGATYTNIGAGLAVESDGNILVTDRSDDVLYRVDPTTGNRTALATFTAQPNNPNPLGVTVDWSSGAIYVVDSNNDAVLHVDATSGAVTLVSQAFELTGSATGTGIDFDSPNDVAIYPSQGTSVAISAATADQAEGNSGSTAFTFTVTRSGNTAGSSSVDYAVTGSGANAADGTDFGGSLPSGSVSFAASETSQTITINVAGDTMVEPDEEFTVTLSSGVATTIDTASAIGTIRNDDADLAIAVSDSDKAEGDSGTTAFTFSVSRSGNTSGAASVDYAVAGSGVNAADGTDFGGSLPSGSVTFVASETSQTITVAVSGDTAVELDEEFTVTLSNPVAGHIATASASGTIRNDDSALAIAAATADQAEGDSGSTAFTFTVGRSGDLSGSSAADYSVAGSGANAADASDFGGTLPSGSVTFAAGESSQGITVNVSGDGVLEADEGFTVTLTNATGGTLATATASGTIRNDDATLNIAAAAADQLEGDSGTTAFTFTVTRSGDTSASSSVDYAVAGSGVDAADATDFGGSLPAGSVNFAAGESNQTLTIHVSGDGMLEADEGFTVTLTNATGGTLVTATASGTIRNDDATLSIAAAAADQPEGDSGTTAFTFTVTRSGDTSASSSVDYAVAGSGTDAADATDFGGSLPVGSVNFATGESSQTLTLDISGDTLLEPDEEFTVTLSNPTAATLLQATAVGTIRNDDIAALDLTIDATDMSEASGSATATVSRNSSTAVELVVTLASDDPEEAEVPASVTIGVGESSTNFTVSAYDDLLLDGTQTVTITATASSHTAASATIDVLDDDLDSDGDGASDAAEGSGDRDNDGVQDFADYDPTGYFYDSASGAIVVGGAISVSCDVGSASFVNGDDGSNGFYQYIVTATGDPSTCIQTIQPPTGYVVDERCADLGTLAVASGPSPQVLGAGEEGSSGLLASAVCGDNPYYGTLALQPGDAVVFNNNVPLRAIATPVPLFSLWGVLAGGISLMAMGAGALRRRTA